MSTIPSTSRQRARALVEQVLKTWDPPARGYGRPADVAQTAVMQTVAYLCGASILPSSLTSVQSDAIRLGIQLFNATLALAPSEQRVPQRFRFRMVGANWENGIAVPAVSAPFWRIICLDSQGHGHFDASPWPALEHILGADLAELEWLDDDYFWAGFNRREET